VLGAERDEPFERQELTGAKVVHAEHEQLVRRQAQAVALDDRSSAAGQG
jgi:hypothetical protein